MTDKKQGTPSSIVIAGVPGLDGEYELDTDNRPFNGNELHEIKRISGVRAGELGEALAAVDYDVIMAFAAIALNRAGKSFSMLDLMDAPIGRVVFKPGTDPEEDEEQDGQSPPAPQEPPSEEPASSDA